MMPGHRLAVLSFAVACITSVPGTHAEDNDMRMLRQQVEELKDTIRQLQERVNALDKNDAAAWVPATIAPATATAPAQASPPRAMETGPATDRSTPTGRAPADDKVVILRNSWRRISTGMRQADVKETLGPPTKEMLINAKVVWYYYYAGLGAGSVFFNGDGRISSSQAPNLGWNLY